ncbi:MAG: hypothetical protein D6770_07510 [Anaerolineae bacterium]|nr:MAG: hypothetical protein D6770_07510 [Anaerolineae bacterium]
MSALRIIGYIAAAILIFFGVLFIWGAGGPEGGGWGWVFTGAISVLLGFGLIYLASRRKAAAEEQEVTLKIDLSGDVNLDQLTCRSCGGALTADNIKMVAGALVVTCPYCGTTYQLTEEPKW